MIDIRLVREEPDTVKAALARRGVPASEVDTLARLDGEHRAALARQEALRAQVKELSRQVGAARKAGDTGRAAALADESRRVGEQERTAAQENDRLGSELRALLLVTPNLPADDAPDGDGPDANVVRRHWWPGMDRGLPEAEPAEHQRVPHWDAGAALGILDMPRGARMSGSMFPVFRGAGARLLRALTALALDRHATAWEEVRPPTLVLTETLTSTGHLPKFADEAYHVERDDLWLIPTAEVPLASMHRGDLLEEQDLPVRMTGVTACFRREAGAAGRETRGLLRVHEFDKVELFAFATPAQAAGIHADMLARAEALLQALELPYRVVDLCTGDLGAWAKRTFDLEVFAPGSDRWLEVSSVSWVGDYQARRASIRYRPADGGPNQLVHTLNGSALAWPRIWAALVEWGRQPDGSVRLPDVLAPWFGAEPLITPR